MIPAILTTLCFAVSGLFSARLSKPLGAIHATTIRCIFVITLLAAYAYGLGQGALGPGLGLLIVSGAIGFGLGDLALFQSYQRIGSRLALLLCQCLAAPIATLTEWIWLGTTLTFLQMFLVFLILLGTSLALAPSDHLHLPKGTLRAGIFFGTLAACGQAWGAVLSRRAYELNDFAGVSIDALTITYQRMLGGVALVFPFYVIYLLFQKKQGQQPLRQLLKLRQVWPYLLVSGLVGPIFGVAFYQWALATTASGVVLAIVATTPIAIMPLTYFIDGDRPSFRSLVGAFLAVFGVIAMLLVGKV
ncbi:MAG: EamA family transporter [Chthoniobacterales bacterium]